MMADGDELSLVDLTFGGSSFLPDLPAPLTIEIPDRGELQVRDLAGPPGAPAVILLHGWTATADLNFHACYLPLTERFRVVAFDHHGHGHGVRARKSFQFEDAAADALAVADHLGIGQFSMVGYSMGGAIAQVLAHEHGDRLDGLVLAATAPYFARTREERLSFVGLTGLAALARFTPSQAQQWITEQTYLQRREEKLSPEAMEQISIHDWRTVLEAGKALGDFDATEWIGGITVPTSVIVTMNDPVVPLRRQVKLWKGITGSDIFRVDGAHDAIVALADRFVPQLLRALDTNLHRPISQPVSA